MDSSETLHRIYFSETLPEVAEIREFSSSSAGYSAVYAVYDMNAGAVAREIAGQLGHAGCHVSGMYPFMASEGKKTIETVTDICRWLLERGADRRSLLLAIGGGITTDIVGFAASVYMRGIRCSYIPTTLLAQVDASVGGKTGVNLDSYKNIIGTVRQPDFVWLCAEVLLTLPYRDFLSGAAEMLKTFIISGGGWYSRAVSFLSGLKARMDSLSQVSSAEPDDNVFRTFLSENMEELTALVRAAAETKAGIVAGDPFESGQRRVLNLGHTFAHAIEHEEHAGRKGKPLSCGVVSPSDRKLTHGKAVAVGIIMAARLSEASGIAAAGLTDRLKRDFVSCGLPTECPVPQTSLVAAMSKDKKSESGQVHFILIGDIGHVSEKIMTADEAVRLLEWYGLESGHRGKYI